MVENVIEGRPQTPMSPDRLDSYQRFRLNRWKDQLRAIHDPNHDD